MGFGSVSVSDAAADDKSLATLRGRHPRSFPAEGPLWSYVGAASSRRAKVGMGHALHDVNAGRFDPSASALAAKRSPKPAFDPRAQIEHQQKAAGKPPASPSSPVSPPSPMPSSHMQNNELQLSTTKAARLHFGASIALSPAGAERSLLRVEGNAGKVKLVPSNAAPKRDAVVLYKIIDLDDVGSYRPVKFGDYIWLQVCAGGGEPTWVQGSVLGARVYEARALPTVQLNATAKMVRDAAEKAAAEKAAASAAPKLSYRHRHGPHHGRHHHHPESPSGDHPESPSGAAPGGAAGAASLGGLSGGSSAAGMGNSSSSAASARSLGHPQAIKAILPRGKDDHRLLTVRELKRQNEGARSLGRWKVLPATPAVQAAADRSGGVVCNLDHIYLEQDFFCMAIEGERGQASSVVLQPLPGKAKKGTGLELDRKCVWTLRLADSTSDLAGMSRGERDAEELMKKARKSLQRSSANRNGARTYSTAATVSVAGSHHDGATAGDGLTAAGSVDDLSTVGGTTIATVGTAPSAAGGGPSSLAHSASAPHIRSGRMFSRDVRSVTAALERDHERTVLRPHIAKEAGPHQYFARKTEAASLDTRTLPSNASPSRRRMRHQAAAAAAAAARDDATLSTLGTALHDGGASVATQATEGKDECRLCGASACAFCLCAHDSMVRAQLDADAAEAAEESGAAAAAAEASSVLADLATLQRKGSRMSLHGGGEADGQEGADLATLARKGSRATMVIQLGEDEADGDGAPAAAPAASDEEETDPVKLLLDGVNAWYTKWETEVAENTLTKIQLTLVRQDAGIVRNISFEDRRTKFAALLHNLETTDAPAAVPMPNSTYVPPSLEADAAPAAAPEAVPEAAADAAEAPAEEVLDVPEDPSEVFDLHATLKEFAGNLPLLNELLVDSISLLTSHVGPAIERAVEDGDTHALADLAHLVTGITTTLNARRLARAAHNLEAAIDMGLPTAGALGTALGASIAEFEAAADPADRGGVVVEEKVEGKPK